MQRHTLVARLAGTILILLALTALASRGASPPTEGEPERREIENGTLLDQRLFPAVVRIWQEDAPQDYCTGTLIDPYWVLTSAHCTSGRHRRRVRVSRVHNGWERETRDVWFKEEHPQWAECADDVRCVPYDLALLQLRTPFAREPRDPYPVQEREPAIMPGDLLAVVGWASGLRAADLFLADCNPAPEATVCATGKVSYAGVAEKGDSGAALLVFNAIERVFRVAAVLSHEAAALDYYALLDLEWIDSTLADHDRDPCESDGGVPPADVPDVAKPPDAPEPFQPSPVAVPLGASGSKVTLMTAEGGGYTLNGEAFKGGTVAAENGNVYTLALVGGNWTATYIPVEVPVTLGTSGATLTMLRAEDGSFTIGGGEGVVAIATAPDGSPQGALAANGNQYALDLVDGEWQATYIQPPPQMVPLGNSGDSVAVSKLEEGSYVIGNQPIAYGSTVKAGNGDTYRLTLANGKWTATKVEP